MCIEFNRIFLLFQCPEDDPLCDTTGDEDYYDEVYNSAVLKQRPEMGKTELTIGKSNF